MRIVCISDTHMRHNVEIPSGDILVHTGDFTIHRDSYLDLLEFAEWFQKLPHTHKLFVPGNHDWVCQDSETTARDILKYAHVLINESATIDNIKFYGTPYQPIFYDWAFNVGESKRKEIYSLIPEDVDVLLTHTPPYGILDTVTRDGSSVGCQLLADRIEIVKPKVHVFGHIHESYGEYHENGTHYINASLCNLHYRAVNKPIIVEM